MIGMGNEICGGVGCGGSEGERAVGGGGLEEMMGRVRDSVIGGSIVIVGIWSVGVVGETARGGVQSMSMSASDISSLAGSVVGPAV